jgi:alpha-D-xyloside xylohydrolase
LLMFVPFIFVILIYQLIMMKIFKLRYILLLQLILTLSACNPSRVVKLEQGLIITPAQINPNGTKAVKVIFVTDKIVHIIATPLDTFSSAKSIMAVEKNRPEVKWSYTETRDSVILSTSYLKVKVSLKTGEISFCDSLSKPVLMEAAGGKTFKPVVWDSVPTCTISQTFNSPSDEALFGLGQHQHGFLNLKGKDVDLTQFNSYISIPYLISNKKYGLLWDNYSITRFGDPRDYQPLSTLKLYSATGEEGGLTAKYSYLKDPNTVVESRLESDINYEYLKLQKNFPANFKLEGSQVVWEGFIEAKETGLYKFLLNSAGYSKLWIDNNLVVDKWRQCWNPNKNQLTFQMEAGKRYPVKIEWKPDGGESFISFKTLTPYPAEKQSQISFTSQAGDEINYYFVYGKNTDEVIGGYREITGNAEMLPKWAMGFWQSRERYKTQDELLGVVKTYRDKKIPFDNIVLDWQYWRPDNWGSQQFDSSRFQDPKGMIADLHDKYNSHIIISVWPKFYEGIANYKLMNDQGFLYTQNIKNRQKDWLGYISTFYDAFNPAAREQFWKLIDKDLYKLGIDGWWLDATEPDMLSNISVEDRKSLMTPTIVKSPSKYFNTYAVLNAQGIYEGQLQSNPNQRPFILTRSAFAGLQRYGATNWSGDIGSRWEDLRLQIPAGLNYCAAGMPYWTTDIGGFAVEKRYEKPNAADLQEWRELQTRWVQYGVFCPVFRIHGQFPYREMFNTAPENSEYFQSMLYYDKLRYRLMPYIYSLAGATYHSGYTIMRSFIMDFADDEKAINCSDEFMFGTALLVAPVTEYGSRNRQVYLPKGSAWYNFYTGEQLQGGQTIKADAPLKQVPLFVKAGSIIIYGPEIQYAMQKTEGLHTIYVFGGSNGAFKLYNDNGLNMGYQNNEYTEIPMKYNDKDQTLTMDAIKGSFKGMEKNYKFRVVFVNAQKPAGYDPDKDSGKIIEYDGDAQTINLKNI